MDLDEVDGMAARFAPAARALAAALPPATGPVLDVRAGAGVWSLAMLEREPHLCATALDQESVLARFYVRAVRLGVAARVDAIAGEYQHAPWPRRCFGRVLLAHLLDQESEAGAETLVARGAASLAPDGRLVVIEVGEARAKIAACLEASGLRVERELDLHAHAPGLAALWTKAR